MKAWILPQWGDVDRLELSEQPEPVAGDAEAVVELEYAALNPADRYLAQGQYPAKPPLPHILGRDGVGIIRTVGKDVTSLQKGQRVLVVRGDTGVSRWGTFAQRVAVAADSLVPPPEGWSVQESAGASLVYLTAYQALTQWPDFERGVVLITGASGGVGVAATQLASAMGSSVVALSRSESKREILKKIGARHVLDPSDPGWPQTLKDAIAPERVDLAIDNIGGEAFNQLLATMGQNGRISVVGRLAGPVPQFNTASLFFRRLRIGGVAVGTYSRSQAHEAWTALVGHLRKADARPLVDRVFAFDQLRSAFARLKEGPMGKVLLDIRGLLP